MLNTVMDYLSLIKSSFHDIRCCDETPTTVVDNAPLGWRAQASSITCVLNDADVRTGYATVGTLEQYNTDTGVPTGVTKPNSASGGNYIPDYLSDDCKPPVVGTPPPSGNKYYFTNYYSVKGHIDLQGSNGELVTIFITPGKTASGNLTPNVHYTPIFHITETGADVPKPATIVFNGNLFTYEAGDVVLAAVLPNIYIEIHEPGFTSIPQV